MINGERVRQARELRGMTQTDLAARLEISQSTIAYIETGRLAASDRLLDSIALQTGFPSSFFRQETIAEFPLGSLLLFRARVSMTTREQSRVHRYAQILHECIQLMARRITSIPLRLPRLTEAPERAAGITRAALGLSPDTPVYELVRTVERAGVEVLALPMDLEHIDAFSLWAGTKPPTPVLAVLQGKPGDRLRYSVAHELGHLVLHQSMTGDVAGIEDQANRFAAEFLLPEVAMRQELVPPITLTGLAQLKRRWLVSMDSLVMRARDLGVISDRQKRYLFQQKGLRGWGGKKEPIDIAEEKPRAFRQMAELLYGLPVDYQRLAKDARLSEQFVREIVKAHAGSDGPPLQETPSETNPVPITFRNANNQSI